MAKPFINLECIVTNEQRMARRNTLIVFGFVAAFVGCMAVGYLLADVL